MATAMAAPAVATVMAALAAPALRQVLVQVPGQSKRVAAQLRSAFHDGENTARQQELLAHPRNQHDKQSAPHLGDAQSE